MAETMNTSSQQEQTQQKAAEESGGWFNEKATLQALRLSDSSQDFWATLNGSVNDLNLLQHTNGLLDSLNSDAQNYNIRGADEQLGRAAGSSASYSAADAGSGVYGDLPSIPDAVRLPNGGQPLPAPGQPLIDDSFEAVDGGGEKRAWPKGVIRRKDVDPSMSDNSLVASTYGMPERGPYQIAAYLPLDESGQMGSIPAFYTAINKATNKEDWYIGQTDLYPFLKNAGKYSAANYFLSAGEDGPEYARETNAAFTAAVKGDILGAGSHFFSSHVAALKDIGFWAYAVPAILGGFKANAAPNTTLSVESRFLANSQRVANEAHGLFVQGIKDGSIPLNPKLPFNTQAGNFADSLVRRSNLNLMDELGLNSNTVRVNQRLYTPDGKYSVPDLFFPKTGNIIDYSYQLKTINTPQIQRFLIASPNATITIVPPSAIRPVYKIGQ